MYNLGEVKDQFKAVIAHSQNIPDPKVDKLFEIWEESKEFFINAFGGLVYEFPEPVSFDLGTPERKARIDTFVEMLEYKWENWELSRFVDDMRDGFFDNLTTHDFTLNQKEIKKGTKLVKAFKYFEKDNKALTDIQNYASRIIQEDKIEGRLCLSVHPLDFLSVSENTYNWRSCHALDGEYRAGNLSYMVDKSTVICYLKSDKEEVLPNFPFAWNSKKWRVLLYFSQDFNMLFAGRQYPFSTDVGLNFILSDLIPKSGLCGQEVWSQWHKEKIKEMPNDGGEYLYLNSAPYVPVAGSLVPLRELVKNLPGSRQFNDVLSSSCYDPVYSFRRHNDTWFFDTYGKTDSDKTRFFIGGSVPCLRCGEHEIELTESMQCIECETEYGTMDDDNFGYCACCNRHIYLETASWVGDDPVCDSCLDTETSMCESCRSLVFNNELTFNRGAEQYLCRYCNNHINEERNWKTVRFSQTMSSSDGGIYF